MKVVELTAETWPALETLFSANKTVGGCWCVWFMRPHAEVQACWGADNKAFLHEQVRAKAPLGLLAVDDDVPIGWVAIAPRSTYPRLDRTKLTASGGGPETWSVTCFFVHPTARRRGLAGTLLDAAMDFARERGASAVEAFPVDPEGARLNSGGIYHGTLAMFLAAGFDLVERRGTRRALVRKDIR